MIIKTLYIPKSQYYGGLEHISFFFWDWVKVKINQNVTHIEENKSVLVGLSEGTMGGGRGKENVREWKIFPSIYEYNIV
jgi:hypothetical protein